jgi:hypothetical protein
MKSKKIYELFGKIIDKTQKMVYAGKNAGKKYWTINIECENKEEVKSLNIYEAFIGTEGNVGAEEIMKEILEVNYYGKKYCFWTQRKHTGKEFVYILLGWKELSNK